MHLPSPPPPSPPPHLTRYRRRRGAEEESRARSSETRGQSGQSGAAEQRGAGPERRRRRGRRYGCGAGRGYGGAAEQRQEGPARRRTSVMSGQTGPGGPGPAPRSLHARETREIALFWQNPSEMGRGRGEVGGGGAAALRGGGRGASARWGGGGAGPGIQPGHTPRVEPSRGVAWGGIGVLRVNTWGPPGKRSGVPVGQDLASPWGKEGVPMGQPPTWVGGFRGRPPRAR